LDALSRRSGAYPAARPTSLDPEVTPHVSREESQHDAEIRRLAEARAAEPGALLPILHAIQDHLGHVPAGKQTLDVCRAEACQSMASRALETYARRKLGVDFHETTADGRVSLEPVYCLGHCACSPAVMVDESVYGQVTPQRLDEILA
jgi:formate dehydrogenase subunit gamma